MSSDSKKNILNGKEFIKSIINTIPSQSGIYKMLDSQSNLLYVGKAKNLKNRVYSYSNNSSPRIDFMVSQIHNIDYIVTPSETDALLLEADLIRNLNPKYNILLKDDKTFPFIKIDTNHPFPKLGKFRGKDTTASLKNINYKLYGPFASSRDVDEKIKLGQNLFQIRTCTDSYFNNRTQPCILHQIKRCSAPCVNKISATNYQATVKELDSFFQGNNEKLKQELIIKMNNASTQGNFEQAIIFRDRIKALNSLTTKQSILMDNNGEADFIALVHSHDIYFIKIFMFRNGHNYGTLDFQIDVKLEDSMENILLAWILQFYQERMIPKEIFLNIDLKESMLSIAEVLKIKANRTIKVNMPKNSNHKLLMQTTIDNAFMAVEKISSSNNKWLSNLTGLKVLFKMNHNIETIEVYDNSHLYGTLSLGAMICADKAGFNKKRYRTFKLNDDSIKSNDDYGIMKHTLERRLSAKNIKALALPQLMLIDGGKGQLNIVLDVLNHLNINHVKVVAVAKGKNRNAGDETLFTDTGEELHLDKFSSTLHFIQMLRNEAHRFAITSVKKSKLRTINESVLDGIPLLGKARKKILLEHFTSIQGIKDATAEELSKVKGISLDVAIKIFNSLH
jgi:excinuclease ABC subunit C